MADLKTRVFAEGFHFLESPRWHGGLLWMSDIGSGQVVTLSTSGEVKTIAEVPGRPSGLGFLPDGTPLVASVYERRVYRIEKTGLELHADLSGVSPSIISEMIVDAQGRAYVDAYCYNLLAGEERKPSRVVLIEPDGRVRIVADHLDHPNGLALSSEGRLLVAESFGHRLSSFRIGSDGGLDDRRVEEELGWTPDGICLDAEGSVWIGLAEKGFVRRRAGQILDTINSGDRKAIACELGGPDGHTLFCLTFKGELEDIGKIPGSRVEIVSVEVPAETK